MEFYGSNSNGPQFFIVLSALASTSSAFQCEALVFGCSFSSQHFDTTDARFTEFAHSAEFEFKDKFSEHLADHHQPSAEMELSDSVQRFRPKVVYTTGPIVTVDDEKYYLKLDLDHHHAAGVEGIDD